MALSSMGSLHVELWPFTTRLARRLGSGSITIDAGGPMYPSGYVPDVEYATQMLAESLAIQKLLDDEKAAEVKAAEAAAKVAELAKDEAAGRTAFEAYQKSRPYPPHRLEWHNAGYPQAWIAAAKAVLDAQ